MCAATDAMESLRNDIVLCILPGFDGTVRLLYPFIARLPPEQEYCLISYPTDRKLGIEELALHSEKGIPRDRPVLLLAVSFSGPVAAHLLHRGNRNYVGAVFCMTFLRTPRPFLVPFLSLFPAGRLARICSWKFLLRRIFFDGKTDDAVVALLRQIIREIPPSILTFRLRELNRLNAEPLLRGTDIPALYLQAAKDLLVPSRSVRSFERTIPGLEIRRIRGPHGLLQSRPDESWKAIREFLASLNKRPSR